MANQKSLDVIGNNLINSKTVGFRAQRATLSPFDQEMMTASDSMGQRVLGDGVGSPITVVGGVHTLMQPGLVESTGRGLDVAISGEGFFNIGSEDGKVFLTRNGGFDLDAQGYLTLPGAGRVLGERGYIRTEGPHVEITSDGAVIGADGEELGKIRVTVLAGDSVLERLDNGLFTSDDALPVSGDYQLVTKSLEQSNVDMNLELTDLIAAQRAFQGCGAALSTIDAMNRKAAQQIAAI